VSYWTEPQVTEFARRFAFVNKTAWHAYVDSVREALIDSFVLTVVLGQDRDNVDVDNIRSMRRRLAVRVMNKYQMANPTAEERP